MEYLITQELFQLALNINDPWYVLDLKFDVESKRLDVYNKLSNNPCIYSTPKHF